MLRAVPKNWFSWKFEIFDGEVCVANLDLADGTPGLFFISAIQGRTFEIFLEEHKEHESWIDGAIDLFLDYDDYPILLREDGRTIASATKTNSFKETFDVVFDQTGYILQRNMRGYRKFELADGSQVVGSIHPVRWHWIGRKAIVELPEYFPLEVQVFITGLVLYQWKKENDNKHSGQSE
jgi:hypothetical protein